MTVEECQPEQSPSPHLTHSQIHSVLYEQCDRTYAHACPPRPGWYMCAECEIDFVYLRLCVRVCVCMREGAYLCVCVCLLLFPTHHIHTHCAFEGDPFGVQEVNIVTYEAWSLLAVSVGYEYKYIGRGAGPVESCLIREPPSTDQGIIVGV